MGRVRARRRCLRPAGPRPDRFGSRTKVRRRAPRLDPGKYSFQPVSIWVVRTFLRRSLHRVIRERGENEMTKRIATLTSMSLLALGIAAFTGSALAGNGSGNGRAGTQSVSAT